MTVDRRGRLLTPEILESLSVRFWAKVEKPLIPDKCWLWIGADNENGYGIIGIGRPLYKATRVSWLLHTGEWPQHDACHTCDNPPCINPAHLFDGTMKQNMQDSRDKGRWSPPPHYFGERNPSAILTKVIVKEIRRAYEAKELNQYELARLYYVSQKTIWNIVGYRTWKD
jgi:hypothetical protein